MNTLQTVKNELGKALLGKEAVIEKILMAILAKGHILLEDIPGVGKTTLAVGLQKTMNLSCNRMQFTPDVLPSDISGFYMYQKQEERFVYQKGAILCNLFLADEINRTSTRTQAALLEIMEEGQVSVEGHTIPLPNPFCVIATQNAYGSAGTQKLPDSQMDRFMICTSIGYPDQQTEIQILSSKLHPVDYAIQQVLDLQELLSMQQQVEQVFVSEEIKKYIVSLVQATRQHPDLSQGGSPRASINLMKMGQACAYLNQRDFVLPKDIQYVWHDVMRHRVFSHASTPKSNLIEEVLEEILTTVEDPSIQVNGHD